MSDHDELLARADDWLSTDTQDDEANRLVRALRAALAAQPQPLLEGTILRYGSSQESGRWIEVWTQADVIADPNIRQGAAVVVYPATPTAHDSFGLNITKAGSATPTHRDEAGNEWITPAEDMWQDDDVASAGSATPTEEGDT